MKPIHHQELKKVLALFIVLLSGTLSAQVKPDSLWKVWNNPKQLVAERLKAMHTLAWDYVDRKPDTAYYFAQLEYALAGSAGDKKYMAGALNTQGIALANLGKPEKALIYYTKSLNLREEIMDQPRVAASLINIGNLYNYYNQQPKEKALEYYNRGLKIYREEKDKEGIVVTLNHLARFYMSHHCDYAMAIGFYTQSLKVLEESGDKRGLATTLNDIGGIHLEQCNYVQSIEYYSRSLKIREELGGDPWGEADMLNNIGANYYWLKNYDKALEYYNNSVKAYQKTGTTPAVSFLNLGLVYKDQKDDAKAMEFLNKSLKISEETRNYKINSWSLNYLGVIYSNQKKYSKAIDYGTKALAIAKQQGMIRESMDAAKTLYESYRATNNSQRALEMHELYISTRDSFRSVENQKNVIRQEYKYIYEKQVAADSVKTVEEKKVTDAHIAAQHAQLEEEKTKRNTLYGGLGLLILFGGIMYNRFRITRRQKGIIESQKQEVERQKELVEEKNREVHDSINYAKRIQSAILPPSKVIKEYLKDSFILYKPKDIVAGDFYWMERREGRTLFAAADCTGHGVPGAMVSVVCNNALNRAVREYGLRIPGEILDKAREIVIQEFEKSDEEVKDGMDITLCSLEGNKLLFAGANNPLWMIRNGVHTEMKADKQPIGKFDAPKPFTTHACELQKGDLLYLFSDGYADQFGGPKKKKFKYKAFQELLLANCNKTMEEQKQVLDETIEQWKGELEQVDDICIIGLRV